MRHRSHFKSFIILCTICLCYAIVSVSYGQTRFSKLDPIQTGLAFENKLIETAETNIITYEYYYNGGGVAAGDFNNDGLIDLYFTANLEENKLYLNTGNFTFIDLTKSAGVEGKRGWKTGVSIADVNDDGFLDIYVCYSGDVDQEYRHNQLFINNGNLTFTDKAKEYGVDDFGHTTHAAFFDMDRDGDLDLYVLNHNIKNLRNFDAAFVKKMVDPDAGDRLYENINGKFVDITQKAGIISNPLGYGLGVNVADVNNDGWPDIYVTNDYVEEDYLYINNKNGTFTECLKERLNHISNFSMGVDIADVNNDGLLDIFTLDMLPEDNKRQKLLYAPDNYELYNNMVENGFHHQQMRNMLQINNGDGTFAEVGQLCGISNTDWSWAALWADFTNDGRKDLYITNGYGRDMINRDFMKFYANERLKHLQGKTDDKMFRMLKSIKSTPLRNYIYENNGNYSFTDRSEEWGINTADFSHGAIYADLDNDGDLDIVDNKMNEAAGVYKNNTIEQKLGLNYLKCDLSSKGKNKFGIGARVTLYTPSGISVLENTPVHGFQSSMIGPLHFGLSDNNVDSISVRWADGHTQWLRQIKRINSTIKIIQNTSFSPIASKDLSFKKSLLKQEKNVVPFKHEEQGKNDFKIQPLMPNMISYEGPKIAKADLNGDRREDIFICGGEGQAGRIFIQNGDGKFEPSIQPDITADAKYEDTDAVFFDADGDGDQDLYVVSGGYGADHAEMPLQDRFYLNVGMNYFAKPTMIPRDNQASGKVVALDYDNDGDIDLFIGGRVVPGKFPLTPQSTLLSNDGQGNFTDITQSIALDFLNMGMVTDAVWADIDTDGQKELIVVGEWMTIKVYKYVSKQFIDETKKYFSDNFYGWWKAVKLADLDNDGDLDLIAGNWGENTQIKASKSEPIELYYSDFDNNGYLDPIMCYFIQGKSYPMASKDELTDQMVGLRQKYVTYDSYSDKTIYDIFDKELVDSSPKLIVDYLKTTWFENVNGKFEIRSLPKEANFSSIHAIAVDDFNHDGHNDILLAGNVEQTRIKLGRMDANFGCLLLGDEKGNFTYVSQLESGLSLKGCVRSLERIKAGGANYFYLAGINGQQPIKITMNDSH